MRDRSYHKWTDISEIEKFNEGTQPDYAKKTSTSRGIAWCPECHKCVGNVLLRPDNQIIGWVQTSCGRCGTQIDWSSAKEYL